MIPLPELPTHDGVYRPRDHAAVRASADRIANDARIPAGYLAYIGESGFDPPIDERMYALAGALSRLQVRARVFNPSEPADHLQHEGPPEATCLLVPGFVPAAEAWATKLGFARAALGDLIVGRARDPRCLTVIAAPSWKAVADAYGPFVRDHLRANYVEVSAPAAPVLPKAPPFAMTLEEAKAAMDAADREGGVW